MKKERNRETKSEKKILRKFVVKEYPYIRSKTERYISGDERRKIPKQDKGGLGSIFEKEKKRPEKAKTANSYE